METHSGSPHEPPFFPQEDADAIGRPPCQEEVEVGEMVATCLTVLQSFSVTALQSKVKVWSLKSRV